MPDYRDTRIGVTNAARILNIRVTDLKDAVHHERELAPGVPAPKPIGFFGTRAKEMYFTAGDVMDCAEALQRA